ncbi:50S ribosomal protein L15e [Candidatus Woesearchaeota archaeon]|nr:50S ribosomal protein L15e [Candidatus Woesearchaeota archaeon]
MGMYKYLRDAWQSDSNERAQHTRMIQWRREPTTLRIEYPTRLDAARSVGYKAKPGYLVIRQRVTTGGRMRPDIVAGRKPKNNRQVKMLDMNYQQIAERRAYERYAANCEVLNSYFVGEDAKNAWYEVILVDKSHPVIQADTRVNGLLENRARVMRGLTMAGRRSRGLLHKGKGAEKMRPSRTADRKRRMIAKMKKEGLNLQTREAYPRSR